MVATRALVEAQVATPVRSSVLPSLRTPVAENCCVSPRGIAGFDGVTTTDCRIGAVTCNVAESLWAWKLAVMVALLLAFNPLARPEATITATVVSEELQVALAVTS